MRPMTAPDVHARTFHRPIDVRLRAAERRPDHAREPQPPDRFSWWEDKQVAVRVNSATVVRGWVLRARQAAPSPGHNSAAGTMTIVLLIDDPREAQRYQPIITVAISDRGEHGQPVDVREWAENYYACGQPGCPTCGGHR